MQAEPKVIALLLVDDEAEFRDATARILERRGFRVTHAESGAQCLERLQAAVPDVVLLDLKMPGMDGIATLQAIRKDHADLPVIILTGHGGFSEALSGIRLEIVDFLQKPVDLDDLARRIRRLLAGGPRQRLREKSIVDLMVPASSYRRVYTDDPIRNVVDALRASMFMQVEGKVTEHGHRTVLVFDRQERFAGLVRIGDVLRLVVPEFLRSSPYSSYFTGMFLAQAKVVGQNRAVDLLGDPVSIDVGAPLLEALHLMLVHHMINLPVMRDGQLAGILRDKDLLLEVADAIVD